MTKAQSKRIFFISWIIETYKRENNLSGKLVSELFSKHKIKEWLYDNYEALHTVSPSYVTNEIGIIIQNDNDNGIK